MLQLVRLIQMGRSHSLTIGRNLIYIEGGGEEGMSGGLDITIVFAIMVELFADHSYES